MDRMVVAAVVGMKQKPTSGILAREATQPEAVGGRYQRPDASSYVAANCQDLSNRARKARFAPMATSPAAKNP